MKHKKLKLFTLFLFTIGITGLQAQETIPAAGGNASGSGGSSSYTVGQITYSTNTGENGSVSEGIQQPFEIMVVTEIKEASAISLHCFPNPTTDFIKLETGNCTLTDLSFQLYDMHGKLLEDRTIQGNETNIAMNHLTPATYFLKIIRDNKEIKTFKIIKNQ